MVDLFGPQRRRLQRTADGVMDQLQVAGFAQPALLPFLRVVVAGGAVAVGERRAQAGAAQVAQQPRFVAGQHRGAAIAGARLGRAARQRRGQVRRRDQGPRAALQGHVQGKQAGARRAVDILGQGGRRQAQGGAHEGRVLRFGERRRGAGELQGVDGGGGLAGQGMARRGHGHGDAVFVPVGQGAAALAGAGAAAQPAQRVCHGPAGQAQPREMDPDSQNVGHAIVSCVGAAGREGGLAAHLFK
ncbi:hypothetical protein [Bordetella bronchiseptica]